MAQITKSAKGTYTVRSAGVWRERGDGTRYRDRPIIASGLKTKREAQAAAAAHETKLRSPDYIAPHELTCRQWREDFLQRRARKVEASTARDYESALRTWWASFDDVPLQRLQPEHLQAMQVAMATKGISHRTRSKVWGITMDALADAVHKRKIAWNLATACDRPHKSDAERKHTEGPKLSWWEPSTVAEFMAFADPEDATDDLEHMLRAAVCLNFALGLRPGELAGLKWTDRDGGVLHVQRSRTVVGWGVVEKSTKTENGVRDVPLTPQADALWKALQARQRVVGMDGYLFAIDGVPVHPQKISDTFAALQGAFRADRPNLKRLRFYDVRHTAITLWLKAGVDLRLVSRMAGHSSMYFTADTYAEVLGSDLDDAAAKMGMLFGGQG